MKEMNKIFKIIFVLTFILSTQAKSKMLSIGSSEAKVTVKVFSSLTCPHCADFHANIWIPDWAHDVQGRNLVEGFNSILLLLRRLSMWSGMFVALLDVFHFSVQVPSRRTRALTQMFLQSLICTLQSQRGNEGNVGPLLEDSENNYKMSKLKLYPLTHGPNIWI